jgi:hypothetical protein
MEATAEFNSVITDLAHLSSVLQSALVSSVILALLIGVIVEVIKVIAHIPFYRWFFDRWWDDLKPKDLKDAVSRRSDWIEDRVGEVKIPDFHADGTAAFAKRARQSAYLPRNLFLKKLENMAQGILEAPALHPEEFLVFSAGAPADDQALALKLDVISRAYPALLAKLKEGEEELALPPSVLSAQERVAAAVDRNLDDLQLRLAQLWPVAVRSVSVLVGVAGSLAIGLGLAGFRGASPVLLLMLIGAGSGLLAPILKDIVGLVTRNNQRQG